MINKRYTLKSLLLPLLACLFLAGTTGCSNEVMPEEGGEMPDNGGTTSFSVAIGRVVTDVPDDGNFDDYINSVRIIAFDNNGKLTYNTLFTASDGGGKAWTSAGTDGISIADDNVSLEAGTYTFYFIANEGEHQLNATPAATLKDQLASTTLIKDELEQMVINYAVPSETTPILMTAQKSWTIMEGTTNNASVELVRALAKLDYVRVKNATGQFMTGTFSLSINQATSYPLFPATTTGIAVSDETKTVEGNLCGENEHLVGTQYYFPGGSTISMSTLTATIDGKTYNSVSTESISVDRNKGVRINASIKPEEQQCLQVNTSIAPWREVELPPTYE